MPIEFIPAGENATIGARDSLRRWTTDPGNDYRFE